MTSDYKRIADQNRSLLSGDPVFQEVYNSLDHIDRRLVDLGSRNLAELVSNFEQSKLAPPPTAAPTTAPVAAPEREGFGAGVGYVLDKIGTAATGVADYSLASWEKNYLVDPRAEAIDKGLGSTQEQVDTRKHITNLLQAATNLTPVTATAGNLVAAGRRYTESRDEAVLQDSPAAQLLLDKLLARRKELGQTQSDAMSRLHANDPTRITGALASVGGQPEQALPIFAGVTGTALGGPVAGAVASATTAAIPAKVVYNTAYLDAREEGLTRDEAHAFALWMGSSEYALEAVSGGVAGKLGKGVAKTALRQWLKLGGKSALIEGASEAATGALQDTGNLAISEIGDGNVARYAEGQLPKNWKDFALNRYDEFLAGAIGGKAYTSVPNIAQARQDVAVRDAKAAILDSANKTNVPPNILEAAVAGTEAAPQQMNLPGFEDQAFVPPAPEPLPQEAAQAEAQDRATVDQKTIQANVLTAQAEQQQEIADAAKSTAEQKDTAQVEKKKKAIAAARTKYENQMIKQAADLGKDSSYVDQKLKVWDKLNQPPTVEQVRTERIAAAEKADATQTKKEGKPVTPKVTMSEAKKEAVTKDADSLKALADETAPPPADLESLPSVAKDGSKLAPAATDAKLESLAKGLYRHLGFKKTNELSDALKTGKVKVVRHASQLPNWTKSKTQGMYKADNGDIYLVASEANALTAAPVLLHELGHKANKVKGVKFTKSVAQMMGEDGRKKATNDIENAAKTGDKLAIEAVRRAEAARDRAPDKRKTEVYQEEIISYAIEAVETARSRSTPIGRLANLPRDVADAMSIGYSNLLGTELKLTPSIVAKLNRMVYSDVIGADVETTATDLETVGGKTAATFRDAEDAGLTYEGKEDGKARFVFSDRDSYVIEDGVELLSNGSKITLPDILDHDKMFDNYPFLENIKVELAEWLDNDGYEGAYDSTKKTVLIAPSFLNNSNNESLRSLLLHEVQHAIQHKEGFVKGANVISLIPAKIVNERDASIGRLNATLESFPVAKVLSNLPSEARQQYMTALNSTPNPTKSDKAHILLNGGYHMEGPMSPAVESAVMEWSDAQIAYEEANRIYEEAYEEAEVLYTRDYGEAEARMTQVLRNDTQQDLDDRVRGPGGIESTMGTINKKDNITVDQTLDTSPIAEQNIKDIESATEESGDFESVSLELAMMVSDPVPYTGFESVTDTVEFKSWFKESQVVSETGKPLTMYTGTSKDDNFATFKAPGNGIWFSSDPKYASEYALDNDSRQMKRIPKPGRPWNIEEVNTASRVIPVYLSIQNPYTITKADFDSVNKPNYRKAQKALFDNLKRQGYDGVNFGGGTWVAFRPEQIKSAIANKGAFDPRKASILESVAEYEAPTSEDFKKWFKNSKIVDENGNPAVWYHGSPNLAIEKFIRNRLGLIFVTPDESFAKVFAKQNKLFPDVEVPTYKLYIRAEKPFDYKNPEHLEHLDASPSVLRRAYSEFFTTPAEQSDSDLVAQAKILIRNGDWAIFETPSMIEWMEDNGYDAMYLEEAGSKNLAVFDPNQLKSADKNQGTFRLDSDNIYESVVDESDEQVTAPTARAIGRLLGLDKLFGDSKLNRIVDHPGNYTASMAIRADTQAVRWQDAEKKAAKKRGVKQSVIRDEIDKKLAAIDLMEDPDQRVTAVRALDKDYPGVGSAIAKLRDLKWGLSRQAYSLRMRDKAPLTESEIAIYKKMFENAERYNTRAYQATFGTKSDRYGKQFLKRAGVDPNSKEGKILKEAIDWLIDHQLVIPDAATMASMPKSQIKRMYETWYNKPAGNSKKKTMIAKLEEVSLPNREALEAKAMQIVKEMLGQTKTLGPIASSMMGKKLDRTILEAKKQVPQEIRSLLGEITDPYIKELLSIARLTQLVARTKMLVEIYEQGEGTMWTEEKTDATSIKLNNQSYGALDGKWVSQAVYQLVKDQLTITTTVEDAIQNAQSDPTGALAVGLSAGLKGAAAAAGAWKVTNVVWSIQNLAFNLIGAPNMAVMNGVYNPKDWAVAFSDTARALSAAEFPGNVTDGELAAEMLYAGVLDSATIGEFRGQVYDNIFAEIKKLDQGDPKFLKKSWEIIKTGTASAREAYALMDVWAKVASYRKRKDILTKYYKNMGIDKSPREIQREAGYDATVTNISYTRAPPLVKMIERYTPGAAFLTYFSETFRVVFGNMYLAAVDAKRAKQAYDAGNTKAAATMVGSSLSRLTGTALATGGIVALTNYLLDNEDEEEKRKRSLDPEWEKNNPRITLGQDKNGDDIVLGLNRFDPIGPVNESVVAVMRAPEGERASILLSEIEGMLVKNRGATQMYKTLWDAAAKSADHTFPKLYRDWGGRGDYDDMSENVKELLWQYVPAPAKSLSAEYPEIVSNREGDWSKTGAVMTAIGGKLYVRNPDKAAQFRVWDFKREHGDIRKDYNKFLENFDGDADELFAELETLAQREQRAFNVLADSYDGYLAYGKSRQDFLKLLKDEKVDADVVKGLMQDQYRTGLFAPADLKRMFDTKLKELDRKSDTYTEDRNALLEQRKIFIEAYARLRTKE